MDEDDDAGPTNLPKANREWEKMPEKYVLRVGDCQEEHVLRVGDCQEEHVLLVGDCQEEHVLLVGDCQKEEMDVLSESTLCWYCLKSLEERFPSQNCISLTAPLSPVRVR